MLDADIMSATEKIDEVLYQYKQCGHVLYQDHCDHCRHDVLPSKYYNRNANQQWQLQQTNSNGNNC